MASVARLHELVRRLRPRLGLMALVALGGLYAAASVVVGFGVGFDWATQSAMNERTAAVVTEFSVGNRLRPDSNASGLSASDAEDGAIDRHSATRPEGDAPDSPRKETRKEGELPCETPRSPAYDAMAADSALDCETAGRTP